MTAPKLTPWITGYPLADRPGWYELRICGVVLVCRYWWSGRAFSAKPGSMPILWTRRPVQFRGLTAPASA